MKAIKFLEWLIDLKFETKLSDYETNHLYIRKLQKGMNFYSQTFNHEMITELFEGWEKAEGYHFVYVYGYDRNDSILNSKYAIIISPEENTMTIKNITYRLPKSLDSFKTLLEEQAGIELNWKQEIIDKYFK